ncbi:MAG: cytochrome-c peroxidase [Bacteroidetes bacterium]|nr:cytochrome-c peroxidase [Bacteroidota bacterium]
MFIHQCSDYRFHAATPYQFPELLHFPKMPSSSSNPVTIEGVDLGRHLFYDPILSFDKTIACASCHRQEAAFSDAPVIFSIGISGEEMNRNTPPLFNLAWYPSLFWDGKAKSIEEQIFHPVRAHDEMNLEWPEAVKRLKESEFYKPKFKAAFGDQEIDSLLIARAIAQFERTFISNQSKYDRVLRGETYFSTDEYEGFVLMNDQTKGDCLHCHTTDGDALGTTLKFSNNGLDPVYDPLDYADNGLGGITGKVKDNGKFKIPSLRNVEITPPYMHDGRFETLEEVLDFYSERVNQSVNIDSKMEFAHKKGAHLSRSEKKKIIVFLKTLTDSTFISNPAFSNPFQ